MENEHWEIENEHWKMDNGKYLIRNMEKKNRKGNENENGENRK